MRYYNVALASLLVASSVAAAQDVSREVADGGIKAAGWHGKIDPGEAKNGGKLEGAKLEMAGKDLHVTTGPAVAYWMPSNVAKGPLFTFDGSLSSGPMSRASVVGQSSGVGTLPNRPGISTAIE